MPEKNFVTGMRIYPAKETSPAWLKGQLVINAQELFDYIEANSTDGTMRIDIKESREGKLYLELNTFVPIKQ